MTSLRHTYNALITTSFAGVETANYDVMLRESRWPHGVDHVITKSAARLCRISGAVASSLAVAGRGPSNIFASIAERTPGLGRMAEASRKLSWVELTIALDMGERSTRVRRHGARNIAIFCGGLGDEIPSWLSTLRTTPFGCTLVIWHSFCERAWSHVHTVL